jgi:allantoinase
MVVSDHSPSTRCLKRGDDFFKLRGGSSGCQSTRQLLLASSLDLPTITRVTSTNVRWLVALSNENVVRKEDLRYRNPISAHEGQPIRGRTVRTMVRAQTVFKDGRPSSAHAGRLMRLTSDS